MQKQVYGEKLIFKYYLINADMIYQFLWWRSDFSPKQIVFLLLYGTLEALVTPSSAVG